MGVFSENAIIGASAAVSGYDIDQSLRLNDGDSAYLARAQSNGNQDRWTWSGWVKRAHLGSNQCLFATSNGTTTSFDAKFTSSDTINVYNYLGGGFGARLITNRVFRDVSSWYHIVIVYDSGNATEAHRLRIYVNGVEESSFSTANYPSVDENSDLNVSGSGLDIGRQKNGAEFFDGYLAEVHLIDGTALTPASFGETNSDTNQWIPLEATELTYGTNGFYLKFQDSSALGDDSSGNTNDFAVTNLAATDQVLDSPTNNFATINGLTESIANRNDFFEGNLRAKANDISGNSSAWFTATIGIPPNTGKYYWEFCDEVYIDAGSFGGAYPDGWGMGMIADDGHTNMMADTDIGNTGWWFSKSNNNVGTSRARGGGTSSENKRVPSTSTGVFKCCYDSDAGSFWFGGDLGWMTTTSTGTPETSAQPGSGNDLWDSGTGTGFAGYTVVPAWATINAGGNLTQLRFNFGQDSTFAGLRSGVSGTAGNPGGGGYGGNADTNGFGDFFYEVPTGFKALCSDNLPDPAIALPTAHFNTATYAGTGASQTIAVGFQPDFVWAKSRNTAVNNVLYDSVRGTGRLESNNTNAEGTRDGFAGFDSNGFDVDSDGGGGGINYPSGRTYVGWAWKAGGTAVSNSDGTITSSVSANTTAGFSIVGYTGQSAAGTIGHGLSQAPEMIILKNRDGTYFWAGYHKDIGNTKSISINDAGASYTEKTWNDTTPSASVFSVGAQSETSSHRFNYTGEDFIAYCFHSVNGYSKVGKYEGNANASGQFVYTGFRPAWLLIKKYDGSEDWIILDNKRDSYNVVRNGLYADLNNAEGASDKMDFTSNGFKIRSTTGVINSSANFLYIAFAESPFKTANAR